eukprot:jgi/Botrbrau1/16531/Bobra.314_1s0004.1
MLKVMRITTGPAHVVGGVRAPGTVVGIQSRKWPTALRRRFCCRSAIEEAQDAPELESSNGNGSQGDLSIIDPSDVMPVKNLRKHLKPRDSPFAYNNNNGGGFVGDNDVVAISAAMYESDSSAGAGCAGGILTTNGMCIPVDPYAKRSGPRRTIYYDPELVTAAVVTCGGLCPGLNDVVQNIVFTLHDYGVPEDRIYGIKYGLRGFYDRHAKPIELTPDVVEGIQLQGGTILGTSRGGADIKEIVRRLKLWGVNMLFVVGGNGGNAAANAIHEECERQDVITAVVGVPKSIDNDILLIDRCFGFDTAVEEAQRSLIAAMVEASSADKGVGLVRLMGRQSGYIAMQASMASGVVDVCLIPEVKFSVPKLIEYVEKLFEKKGYCVICVAEGAGQDIVAGDPAGTDASGNPILKDIGQYLKDAFKKAIPGVDVKYIDPTYMIRAIPTNSTDRIYCKVLGSGAVHGAFAGYTGFTVGLVNTHYVYLPIPTIIQAPRTVNPQGREWNRLKWALNQPDLV